MWKLSTTFISMWAAAPVIGKVSRAKERALIAVGERIVSEEKQVVHRDTGTLSRSIHLAQPGYTGPTDQARARSLDLHRKGAIVPLKSKGGDLILLAGTWIDYAQDEIDRGGAHDYVTPAVEIAGASSKEALQRALAAEEID